LRNEPRRINIHAAREFRGSASYATTEKGQPVKASISRGSVPSIHL